MNIYSIYNYVIGLNCCLSYIDKLCVDCNIYLKFGKNDYCEECNKNLFNCIFDCNMDLKEHT